MSIRNLFTVFCRITGVALGILGALVLSAQCAEWWSFGDWNAVSIRYVLGYFNILPQPLISTGYRLLDLPLSAVLLVAGGLIAALGGRYAPRSSTRPSE